VLDLKPNVRRMNICADAYQLLKIIDAEFRTDPMSVQCFDLRVVERVRKLIEAGERLNEELPDHIKL
jgi:hypothetical protein